MSSHLMHGQSFPCGTDRGTKGALETSTLDMFGFHMILDMVAAQRTKRTLETMPQSCPSLLHVLHYQGI